jgi:hypothetical protein
MRNTRRRTVAATTGAYPALTWRILVANKRGTLTDDDAAVALEAVRLRQHPKAIEKFIDVSIRIKEHEDRRTPCTPDATIPQEQPSP